ncbi:phosphoglycolate phosphatase [Companilactobacillus sp. RD055328]|uniref:HAD-IA family hydrolase n=1 Tax=Companilactobacillus sp. RD055328 TaxID=2916634 RepID=UPI001FC83728|nr:HAD-IA family hydrolase [Companilactobacillus sp. RD055328]GKQ42648.1 phosphoglycolate phosphatase [Companilactobacillus sp. RD055328]
MKTYNLIWDFDGNLYDTYPVMFKAYKEAMNIYGVNLSKDEITKSYRHSKFNSLKSLIELNAEKYNFNADEFNQLYHKLELKEQIKPNYFEGADEVLKKVSENGYKNFLLTHRDKSAIDFLKQDNLDKYFTDYVTSEMDLKRKPDPEAINYLINKYDLNINDTYMIGDRSLDLLAGVNAGVKTIYFNVDSFDDKQYADYCVDNLLNILEIID